MNRFINVVITGHCPTFNPKSHVSEVITNEKTIILTYINCVNSTDIPWDHDHTIILCSEEEDWIDDEEETYIKSDCYNSEVVTELVIQKFYKNKNLKVSSMNTILEFPNDKPINNDNVISNDMIIKVLLYNFVCVILYILIVFITYSISPNKSCNMVNHHNKIFEY